MVGFLEMWGNLPNMAFPPLKGKRKNADYLNSVAFMETFNRITNIAISRFKWTGLPDSCNERALELTLYFYGKALFFNDENLGYIHTPVSLPGPFNVYYESVRRNAYSFNYEKWLDIDNSVLIRGNKTMTPDYFIAWSYSPKIADALRSIDVHTQTIKRPFAISATENERRSVEAALEKVCDNEIAVVGTKFTDKNNGLGVLNFNVNCYLSEMWANLKNYYQQAFSALGVDNSFTSKKERLVVNESEGEQNVIRHTLQSAYDERKKACEEINKMFGLNLNVEINQIDTFAEERAFLQSLQNMHNTPGGGDGVRED